MFCCLFTAVFLSSCVIKPSGSLFQNDQKTENTGEKETETKSTPEANQKDEYDSSISEEKDRRMQERLSVLEKRTGRRGPGGRKWEQRLQGVTGEQEQKQDQTGNQARALVQAARKHMEQGEYKKAEEAARKALENNPNLSEARTVLSSVLKQQGKLKDDALRQHELIESWEATKDQLVNTAKVRFRQGKELYKERKYQKATQKFREAVQRIRYMPVVGPDLESLQSDAEAFLEKAMDKKKEKEQEQKKKRELAIQKLSQKEEYQRQKQEERKVQKIIEKARTAFEDERYEKSVELLEEAKRIDPTIEEIDELKRIAWRMGNRKRSQEIQEDSKEEFQKWYRNIRDTLIPQDKTVTFPSKETWNKIDSREPPRIETEVDQLSQSEKELKQRLKEKVIPNIDIDEMTFFDFINRIQDISNINIVADPDIDSEIANKSLRGLKLRERSVWDVLEFGLDNIDSELDFTVDGEVVQVFQRGKVTRIEQQIFDIRDLVQEIKDYPGPKVLRGEEGEGLGIEGQEGDEPQQFKGGDFESIIKQFIAPETWRNRQNTNIRADRGLLFVRNDPEILKRIEEFLNRIRDRTGIVVTVEARFLEVRSSWMERVGTEFRGLAHDSRDNDQATRPARLAIDEFNVTDNDDDDDTTFTAELSGEISGADGEVTPGFLDEANQRLRFTEDGQEVRSGRQLLGRTQTVFGTLLGSSSQAATDFLEVGGGASGSEGQFELSIFGNLSRKALVNALKKKSRGRDLVAPRLTLFNNQRGNVTFARQRAYVSDIDPQVAADAVVGEPVPDVVNDQAFILDVRPTVSQNRRYITLTLRPSVASLTDAGLSRTESLIGVTDQGPSFGTIETPEIEIKRIRQTATVPDGGTLYIGGLRSLMEHNRSSEVPVLSNVPILEFLFSEKEDIQDNFELIILVTAKIRIMEELEDKRMSRSSFVDISEEGEGTN